MSTFKRPKMLERAIKSVINQTFQDWELIIVDDCSQDGKTEKLCEKHSKQDNRIRYIKRCPNFGAHTQVKNVGIQNARADLIAYLDDDNQYRRDHLQVLYKYLGNNDIVYGDRWLVDKTGKGKDMVGIRSDFNSMLLSQTNYIDTSDVLVKKKCLEEIGGWDEELPKFADWNLWLRLAKAGYKFQRIPIIITNYYIHSQMAQFRIPNKVDPMTGRPMPTFKPDACKIWPDKTIFGKRKPLKVAIFTLTMDRLDYTKKMSDSMKKNSNYEFDWYVVDNGSKDETVEWLKAHNGIKKVIFNKQNVGISKASNQALDAIGGDYDIIIKVDNDCLFLTENWLSETVDLYERQQRVVISPRVEGLRDSPGGVPRTQYVYIGKHFFGLAPHLGGICIAAPASIYKNFRWEEEDFLHGEQDYVFSQYAITERYLLVYNENIVIEHIEGTAKQEETHPEYFAQRKKLKTTRHENSVDNA